MDLQSDGRYRISTPLRTEPVAHQNTAVPTSCQKLMPVRTMPQL
jgi:hypothetical protein